MANGAIQSVTKRLIQRITAYSVVCVLAICVAQGWYSWRHMSEEFDKSLLLIGETQLPLLAIGVWDAEPSAIERQLAQVSQRPYIAYARLTADVGAVLKSGILRYTVIRTHACSTWRNRMTTSCPSAHSNWFLTPYFCILKSDAHSVLPWWGM